MLIKEIQYFSNPCQGLAERIVKQFYQKKGWWVIRGTIALGKIQYSDYPSVLNASKKAKCLIQTKVGQNFNQLLEIQNGIPDFFMARKNNIQFVEVKLEQESIKENQKRCIFFLDSLGLPTMVVRIKRRPYRLEKTGDGQVLMRQERLWRRYSR